VVYGGTRCASSKNDSKWASLRALNCETFLLIAASYTPPDVAKLNRTEFDFLVAVAPEYLGELPPKWMFRKEIQLAVVAHAELGGMSKFKRSMHIHSLERLLNSSMTEHHQLEDNNLDVQEAPKCPRTHELQYSTLDVQEARKRPRTGELRVCDHLLSV